MAGRNLIRRTKHSDIPVLDIPVLVLSIFSKLIFCSVRNLLTHNLCTYSYDPELVDGSLPDIRIVVEYLGGVIAQLHKMVER